MALALIGESIISAVIDVLIDRIASPEVKDFFKGRKLKDGQLKELKAKMRSVGKLLNDAEEKQITDSAVKEWLDELKDAVYKADDFLDEIAYKALQLKLEAETPGQTCMDQVQNLLSSLFACKKGMGKVQPELEKILESLEELVEQKDVLGLIECIGEKSSSRRTPTTSLIDESGVYGRDADKEALMKLLLSNDINNSRLDVIFIVGMGGVGKTTLAQLVHKETVVSNDRSQKNSFDLKAWVYVSEELDVLKVTKDILKGVGSMNCDNMTEDQLHSELEKKLSGNKVLLVLDDVWSENQVQWEFLLKPFMSVRQGSKIIVTTRNENVASINSIVSIYHLRQLTDDDCWLVLSKLAFANGNFSTRPELEVIGREIARKCNGLPLAAKTLGGLLCHKRDDKEWRKILKSNLWELPNDNALSALRLSYHYLPSHLKQCFAYCAIFPKGYRFKMEKLVPLWMAEGFLVQPKGDSQMEDVGEEYFNDLVSRSFFQQSSMYPSSFVMHDLINDLACFVSGEFCFRWEIDDSRKNTEKTRHISYTQNKMGLFEKFEGICDSQLLRTFLNVSSSQPRYKCDREVMHNLLPALKHLRVLSLRRFDISELLDSINNMTHLRYIDLSKTSITRLPESVCNLYNLQTLILFWCLDLVELPANMRKLIHLHHLDIQHTKLQEMPLQMGKLRKLRKLTDFFVGKQNGCGIEELGELQHLRGKLCVRNLQNVTDASDALEVVLKGKEHLKKLELSWNVDGNDSLQEQVLEKLQPHVNLKCLSIYGYRGMRFPDWIGDSSFLQELCLRRCPNLTKALSTHLPSLTKLEIWECQQLEIECFPLELFPKLEFLSICKCPSLVSFSKEGSPKLTELHLSFCLNLKSLPKRMHSLVNLKILGGCPEVESFPIEVFSSKLQSLYILGCKKLIAGRMQWDLQKIPSLSYFTFGGYNDLESFPEETLLPSTLKSLTIRSLPKLKSLDYKGLQHLTSLRELTIYGCPQLQSMPEEGLPSSLSSLVIRRCPLLEKRCIRETGEDWHKISHIPEIKIN